jgi:PAS domain S-box-containing protein
MIDDRTEDEELRSVTLETARAVFLARRRAEEELVRAKDELWHKSEWLRVTLASIGDAVITTDTGGRVLSLNRTAESLSGWTEEEAKGRPVSEVFRIVVEETGELVESPVERALREGAPIELTNQTLLIARDGGAIPIDDSAAPILDERSGVHGVVLVFRSIVERRKSELALRERERELSDFFENASVGLHCLAPDGTILRVNKAELDLLGYSEEEYLGRHIAEFHLDPGVMEDVLTRLAAGETVRGQEARVRCKDGTIKDVVIDSSALWENGRLVHTRGFLRDVTDRKRADEAQTRLAAIVESSQDAIVGKTLDSRIVSWNFGAQQLFGYSAEEAIGESVTMLIPAERQDEERLILERLSRGERIEHYETVRVDKSGRRIEVSLTISPIRDAAGRIVGASKIARDVTARKRADRRAAMQNAVTQALAESSDLEEAVPKLLQSICESLEWEVGSLWEVDDERSVLRCTDIYHLPQVEVPRFEAASRARVFERGAGLPGRVWASGASTWIPDVTGDENFSRAPLAIGEGLHTAIGFPVVLEGRVLGVLEFFTREVWEPDEVLLDVMKSVGSQIGQFIERRRAEAALKDADRRKDEFLAMLSHELRNPLAPIRNAVQIFRTKKLSALPELQWATELIDRQVHHMTRLVDDLLDVSRITQGKVELRKERVELTEVLKAAVEASRPWIEKRGHRLKLNFPPRRIQLVADPTRLAQMVSNLLNNAAKYTGHGGSIELSAMQEAGNVVIRVKDNGIGIPSDMLSRVFDLFTQVGRAAETETEGGLGIGLTLVKRLAEMHGGSVEAHSEGPGKGSEFMVRVPASKRLPADDSSELEGAPDAASSLRILVVDDNADAADSLSLALRMMGHVVATVHEGIDALETTATFHPDVILLDIGLPGISGYEVARRIRERIDGNKVILVALTGWGQEEDRDRSREAGFNHHMTKPVDFRLLHKLLVEAISGRQSR